MEQEKIATETMSKVEGLSSPNKNNEEEMTMAERKTVNNEESVEEEKEKKPAAKKASVKKEEEKVRFFKHPLKWCKQNWKYLACAGGGVVAGATATYGAGKVGEHIVQKRNHREDEE